MPDEVVITASELGAYTNNISNKEGIKKVVKAINDGLNPDLSDYQKKLTAGDNITITEEDVISASKTVYNGGEGIKILSDEISLQDWEYVDQTKYGELFNQYSNTLEDLIISIAINKSGWETFYIPKGFNFGSDGYMLFGIGSDNCRVKITITNFISVNPNISNGATLFKTGITNNITYYELSIYDSTTTTLKKTNDNTMSNNSCNVSVRRRHHNE